MSGRANEHGTIHRGTGGVLVDMVLRRYLPGATIYRRAVGFFSSSVFVTAEAEFASFFRGGGVMELICSPRFGEDDIAAIHEGLYHPGRWDRLPLEVVLAWPRERKRRGVLAWAVARRQVEVRVALVSSGVPHAIYHEKIGLFVTRDKHSIAFEGSANESANAFVENFERIVVHDPGAPGWGDAVAASFELLWENQTPGVEVVSFHEALRRRAIRPRVGEMELRTDKTGDDSELPEAPGEFLRRPARLELRPYQEEAIRKWFEQKGRGIFAMATGTGKTITALATMEELFKRVGPPLVIIIIAPYLQLVRQWVGVAKSFGLDPINCSGARTNWTGAVDAALFLASAGKRPVVSLVTTNSTFAESAFQGVLERISVRTVIVADEVHNLGARALQEKLPDRVKLRLGLSATPERWMDEDGTRAIADYFGAVACDLDLAQAIRLKPPVLTPYTYHPVLVELEEDEREEYLRLTQLLARFINSPRLDNLSDAAVGLLLKRARLVACARNKIPALLRVIAPYKNSRFNLVYCGDGRVEFEDTAQGAVRQVGEEEVTRQVDAVARELGTRLEMNVGIYTADTPDPARQELIKEFEEGRKNALIAIRCLDEGVDIPQVRRAFILASSTNPRQFIQRRGRVLRLADGKDSAEIFDFVVVPPIDSVEQNTNEFRAIRNLVTREMQRVLEFARLAVNGPQAEARLRPVLEALRLLHL